jgi:serine/threonine-protein phosphatase 6 regulatory ankyrin repeat subunit B
MNDGTTPLYVACQNGHGRVVGALLTKKEININRAKNGGVTPLLIACQEGYVGIINMLLARKEIQINKVDSQGATALLVACQVGHMNVVKALLRNKEIDMYKEIEMDKVLLTPLAVARHNNHTKIATFLQKKYVRQIHKKVELENNKNTGKIQE